MDMERKNHNIL